MIASRLSKTMLNVASGPQASRMIRPHLEGPHEHLASTVRSWTLLSLHFGWLVAGSVKTT